MLLQVSPGSQAMALDIGSNDTVGDLIHKVKAMTGIPSKDQQLRFQGHHIAPGCLLLACGIRNESTLSLVIEGSESSEPPLKRRRLAPITPSESPDTTTSVDAAFEDLGILRRCLCRIHRFSSGVEGRELRVDGDRCASLGHWSLIATGGVNDLTLSPFLLHDACRAGRADAVHSLVTRYGLDVDGKDIGGWTPLHTAMVRREEAVVRCLLALGAEDVESNDGVHASSLRPDLWRRVTGEEAAIADTWEPPGSARETVEDLVGMVIEGSVSADVMCHRVCAATRPVVALMIRVHADLRRWTILSAAAWSGCYSVCRKCTERCASIVTALYRGTPLFNACRNGHLECVRLLLGHGADARTEDWLGMMPLFVACERGHLDCADLLLPRGASDEAYALWIACAMGRTERVLELLDSAADVNNGVCGGVTPLIVASGNGQLDCARLLLDRGVDVNWVDYNGRTALFHACQIGRLECAQLLVDRGADVNKAANYGLTPLHIACIFNHPHVAALLLERGADPTKRDNDGRTPAHNIHVGSWSPADPKLADLMELAALDRAAAIERLWRMDATGPR